MGRLSPAGCRVFRVRTTCPPPRRAIELETRRWADGDALGPRQEQVPPVGVEMKGTWHSWKDAQWFLHVARQGEASTRGMCATWESLK